MDRINIQSGNNSACRTFFKETLITLSSSLKSDQRPENTCIIKDFWESLI